MFDSKPKCCTLAAFEGTKAANCKAHLQSTSSTEANITMHSGPSNLPLGMKHVITQRKRVTETSLVVFRATSPLKLSSHLVKKMLCSCPCYGCHRYPVVPCRTRMTQGKVKTTDWFHNSRKTSLWKTVCGVLWPTQQVIGGVYNYPSRVSISAP